MPSSIHDGVNSGVKDILAPSFKALGQKSGLRKVFYVYDEYTANKGLRSDAEYLMYMGSALRPIVCQEICVCQTLPNAARKVS